MIGMTIYYDVILYCVDFASGLFYLSHDLLDGWIDW